MKLFSRHYGTERFFIMLFLCLALLIGLGTWGGVIQHRNNAAYVSETSIYTREYVWSRMDDKANSGRGNVVGMISSSDNTSVFLLLRNTGTASSFNAEDYEVFLTGRDSKMVNVPSMTTYVYGSTGYVGFYFTDSRGFANQVYSMIVRNDTAASIMAGETRLGEEAARDTSFKDHNQIRLYVNFGAKGVNTSEVMDEVAVDASMAPLRILAEMDPSLTMGGEGLNSAFNREVSEAQGRLTTMSEDLMLIVQHRDNLKSMGVVVPELPYYIRNDKVDTIPNDFTSEFNQFQPSMVRDSGPQGSGSNIFGEGSGGTANTEPDGDGDGPQGIVNSGLGATYLENKDDPDSERPYYYLHTDYLFPGQVAFTWQGRRLSQGLITQISAFRDDKVTSAGKIYENYVAWQDGSTGEYGGMMPTSVSYSSWRRTDGTYVDMTKAAATDGSAESRRAAECKAYEKAVNQYLADKIAYFDTLDSMLQTENGIYTLGEIISTNGGTKVQNLWLY